jgi:hypothetical protein
MQEDEGKLAPVEEGMSTEQLEEIEELARRAVACKRWRWMPGMLSEKGLRVFRRDDDGYVVGYYANQEYICECVPGTLPDLRDPATVGCLLALVREAWNSPSACLSMTEWVVGKPLWTISVWQKLFSGRTEADALVAALEAAR